ncbi:MAG: glycogen synthase [Synergistaceae bacterium]|jgi:starch synthase|nr:glycogen synthase [Synergistaceae bacterium]
MQILFAASEAHPFFVSDSDGVMTGGLPAALHRRGAAVSAVLPLYGDLSAEWRGKLKYITSFTVPVGWRNQYCGLFELNWRDMTWYFLDNEYYFKRLGLYGFYDDGERFAFFSRAILEMLFHTRLGPDILHCNGWQTALVPIYLNLFYRNIGKFARLKAIFTIHDIKRQYTAPTNILEGTFGIGREDMHVLEYGGVVNLTKGAIEASDLVSTLSPSYAGELLDPAYGCGLDDFLQKKQHKIHGILGGIDISDYNPLTDPYIPANYCVNNISEGKSACKKALREEFGLEEGPSPVIGMVSDFTEDKGLDLIMPVADEMIDLGVQLAIVGSGDGKYEKFFTELAIRRRGEAGAHIGDSEALARIIYAGSDIFLMPSRTEPCGFGQMAALRYGTVPVVRETGGLRDTVRENSDGRGNGFTFAAYDSRDMLSACLRARNLYYGGGDGWACMVLRAMRCDNGWAAAAQEYMDMYSRAAALS